MFVRKYTLEPDVLDDICGYRERSFGGRAFRHNQEILGRPEVTNKNSRTAYFLPTPNIERSGDVWKKVRSLTRLALEL